MKKNNTDLMSILPKPVLSHIHHLERMRQDFVANVSHELRTPLTVIHGYLEMLLKSETNTARKKMFTQMFQQSSRMQNVIADLLLLSSLENKDFQQTPNTVVKVHALLALLIQEALALSGSKHTFFLITDKNLVIKGNENELRTLFSNIIFNAVRYTPTGGRITVTWKKNKKNAIFEVKDTGIGIAKIHIPRLTERFYRVDKARSRDSGGTGLGLAIVKHILIRHQGKLIIQSAPGKGSTFKCLFPLL